MTIKIYPSFLFIDTLDQFLYFFIIETLELKCRQYNILDFISGSL